MATGTCEERFLYGPRDVPFEERERRGITAPTDAVIRMALTCVCGSGLWGYRGASPIAKRRIRRTKEGHDAKAQAR
jgi:threonine dehydrogenase-like Zn-dependent dehydrogenase